MNRYVRYRINTPSVVADVIDAEVVIVNLETGSYYSLQQSGAVVWSLIEQGMNAEQASALMMNWSGASRDEISAAVEAFIGELQDEQLVVRSEDQSPLAALPAVDHQAAFEIPRLERYDEMQEMLLYDPIHDVDETGWPNLPADAAPSVSDGAAEPSPIP